MFEPLKVGTGDVVAVATGVIFFLQYRLDRKARLAEEEKTKAKEQEKHEENVSRLDRLSQFQGEQMRVNEQSEEKLDELQKQTASIDQRTAVIAATMEGIDKRTTRIERQLDEGHS